MHIWTIEKWRKVYADINVRKGLRLRCEKGVDDEVKRACKEFCHWLRTEYYFPVRVPIYLKSSYRIKAMDGEMVCGTFFQPFDRKQEPYIRISTGDYSEMLNEDGKDNALAATIGTIAHELTHYFQWINDIPLTAIGEERQAKAYSKFIIFEYSETREHP